MDSGSSWLGTYPRPKFQKYDMRKTYDKMYVKWLHIPLRLKWHSVPLFDVNFWCEQVNFDIGSVMVAEGKIPVWTWGILPFRIVNLKSIGLP